MISVNIKEAYKYFLYGNGVNENKSVASKYFKIAADNGIIEAMKIYGDGVLTNKREALKFIKILADKGDSVSLYLYGRHLFSGDCIHKNII